jgi:hypothetical protein
MKDTSEWFMAEFDSWQDYWNFAQSVKHNARYVFEDYVDKFLRTVIATSKGRKRVLPSGRHLWRAQQGYDWKTFSYEEEESTELGPLPPARMKPPLHSAREGRVNPKGIPCLYLATDKDTAMAEVRPWIGSYLSVGQFETLKDLAFVDCSVEHANIISHVYSKEPGPDEREKAVWAYIDHAFSEPVSVDESSADYAPTQILGEAFRSHGYDGIVYKSLLGEGFNVALFDINAADLVNCFLYKVKSVTFGFDEAASPYFVSKHLEGKKKDDAESGAPGDTPGAGRP